MEQANLHFFAGPSYFWLPSHFHDIDFSLVSDREQFAVHLLPIVSTVISGRGTASHFNTLCVPFLLPSGLAAGLVPAPLAFDAA